jgi:hypothetical protein
MKIELSQSQLLMLALAICAVVLYAQPGTGAFSSVPDITGTGATVQIATSGQARWCQLQSPGTNSSTDIRWGDSNVGASRGSGIAAGGGQMVPFQTQLYSLSALYAYIPNGDKLRVSCGQ